MKDPRWSVLGAGSHVWLPCPKSRVPVFQYAAFLYVPFETVLNQTFYDSSSKKFWVYLFANIEQRIAMIILWWSEISVSEAIDFIKRFGMFVIIWSMPVGIFPLQQVGFLIRYSNKKDSHKLCNWVLSGAMLCQIGCMSNHQAKQNFWTRCYIK